MTVRYIRDGYVVTFTFAENARPTFQYNDGPEHVAYSESHAQSIAQTLMTRGFEKEK
jgi:hypothetical protein